MIGDVVLLLTNPAHVGVRVADHTYMCEDGVTRDVPDFQTQLISDALTTLKEFEEAVLRV